MAKIKNISVKATIWVDNHHIDFELLPTIGFVKKPFGWCIEDNDPVGYTYSIAVSWLIFGLTISYLKRKL